MLQFPMPTHNDTQPPRNAPNQPLTHSKIRPWPLNNVLSNAHVPQHLPHIASHMHGAQKCTRYCQTKLHEV